MLATIFIYRYTEPSNLDLVRNVQIEHVELEIMDTEEYLGYANLWGHPMVEGGLPSSGNKVLGDKV